MTTSVKYFASESVMLFARFLDELQVNRLQSDLLELVHSILGRSASLDFKEEWFLLGSLFYYVPMLATENATVGQSFCGLSLGQLTAMPTTPTATATNDSLRRQPTLSVPTFKRMLVVCALYSLLPYLNSRKKKILTAAHEICSILLSSEAPTPRSTPASTAIDTDTASAGRAGGEEDEDQQQQQQQEA